MKPGIMYIPVLRVVYGHVQLMVLLVWNIFIFTPGDLRWGITVMTHLKDIGLEILNDKIFRYIIDDPT